MPAEVVAAAVAAVAAVVAAAAPTPVGVAALDPTTTLELSSSLDQEAPTTLDTETNAHSDVPSMEDAEMRTSAGDLPSTILLDGFSSPFSAAASAALPPSERESRTNQEATTAITATAAIAQETE